MNRNPHSTTRFIKRGNRVAINIRTNWIPEKFKSYPFVDCGLWMNSGPGELTLDGEFSGTASRITFVPAE